MEAQASPQSGGASCAPTGIGEAYDELCLVFGYLNFRALSACRMVSKLWYDASLKHWLKRAPVKGLWERGNERERDTIINEFLERFHGDEDVKFSEYEYGAALCQFKKFRLGFISAKSEVECESQRNLLTLFLKRCGIFITRLELDNINLHAPQAFENVVYSKYAPNLQHLAIFSNNWMPPAKSSRELRPINLSFRGVAAKPDSPKVEGTPVFRSLLATFGIDIDHVRNYGHLPIEWIDLLSHFSTLERLEIGYISREELSEVLDAIERIRGADKTKLVLRSLYLYDELWDALYHEPERLLNFFRVSQLPLEELQIPIFRHTKAGLIFDMINQHSVTLKELSISIGASSDDDDGIVFDIGLELPLLEHLTKLEICGRIIISSLSILKLFPNLEVLNLSASSYQHANFRKLISGTTEQEMEGVIISSLKKFKYENKELCGPGEIRKIEKWMPNLTSLEMAVTNDGLAAACASSWPCMESMNLKVGIAGDENLLERGQLTGNVPVIIPRNLPRSPNQGAGTRQVEFRLRPFGGYGSGRRKLEVGSLDIIIQSPTQSRMVISLEGI